MTSLRKAFTLIELVVVIAIIGILAALLLSAVQAARASAARVNCQSNMRQIGLALQNYVDRNGQLPAGWTGNAPDGPPGWSWATELLPDLEEQNVYDKLRRDLPIDDPANAALRTFPIRFFLCPADPSAGTSFLICRDAGQSEYNFQDDGPPMFELARSNYVGVFGTLEIEDVPGAGDGVFFYDGRVTLGQVGDGLSNTLFVGERSSRLGGSTWTGVVHGAAASMARIVGTADHPPNHPTGHFDDFSAHHTLGTNFLLGDGSVRLLRVTINISVYQALATRNGGEAATVP